MNTAMPWIVMEVLRAGGKGAGTGRHFRWRRNQGNVGDGNNDDQIGDNCDVKKS